MACISVSLDVDMNQVLDRRFWLRLCINTTDEWNLLPKERVILILQYSRRALLAAGVFSSLQNFLIFFYSCLEMTEI